MSTGVVWLRERCLLPPNRKTPDNLRPRYQPAHATIGKASPPTLLRTCGSKKVQPPSVLAVSTGCS
jgi:hypothetical protein